MGVPAFATLVRSRQSLGLTQRDVAERIGISVAHFSKIENSHRTPTSDQLFSWAEAVQCVVSVKFSPIAENANG